MPSVMFVCLGNICRSPAAEAILKHLVGKNKETLNINVQSSGIGSWHIGQLPDERMRTIAQRRGFILSSRAQQFQRSHFDEFDYILVVDHHVLNTLYQYAETPEHKAKIHLITAFSHCYSDEEIPDPFYSGEAGFDLVLDMLEDSCEGLLQHLKTN